MGTCASNCCEGCQCTRSAPAEPSANDASMSSSTSSHSIQKVLRRVRDDRLVDVPDDHDMIVAENPLIPQRAGMRTVSPSTSAGAWNHSFSRRVGGGSVPVGSPPLVTASSPPAPSPMSSNLLYHSHDHNVSQNRKESTLLMSPDAIEDTNLTPQPPMARSTAEATSATSNTFSAGCDDGGVMSPMQLPSAMEMPPLRRDYPDSTSASASSHPALLQPVPQQVAVAGENLSGGAQGYRSHLFPTSSSSRSSSLWSSSAAFAPVTRGSQAPVAPSQMARVPSQLLGSETPLSSRKPSNAESIDGDAGGFGLFGIPVPTPPRVTSDLSNTFTTSGSGWSRNTRGNSTASSISVLSGAPTGGVGGVTFGTEHVLMFDLGGSRTSNAAGRQQQTHRRIVSASVSPQPHQQQTASRVRQSSTQSSNRSSFDDRASRGLSACASSMEGFFDLRRSTSSFTVASGTSQQPAALLAKPVEDPLGGLDALSVEKVNSDESHHSNDGSDAALPLPISRSCDTLSLHSGALRSGLGSTPHGPRDEASDSFATRGGVTAAQSTHDDDEGSSRRHALEGGVRARSLGLATFSAVS